MATDGEGLSWVSSRIYLGNKSIISILFIDTLTLISKGTLTLLSKDTLSKDILTLLSKDTQESSASSLWLAHKRRWPDPSSIAHWLASPFSSNFDKQAPCPQG